MRIQQTVGKNRCPPETGLLAVLTPVRPKGVAGAERRKAALGTRPRELLRHARCRGQFSTWGAQPASPAPWRALRQSPRAWELLASGPPFRKKPEVRARPTARCK